MATLSIIGAGRVGKVLGALLHAAKIVKINSVFNRQPQHAIEAVQFIGAGHPITSLAEIKPSDYYMVTTPDAAINLIAQQLLQHRQLLLPGSIIFHCSGVTPSSVFSDFCQYGCYNASVHPVKSFADPSLSVTHFAGTYCGIEGHATAVIHLSNLFTAIKGIPFVLNTETKAIYHAATAMACNHLVALMEVAINMYIQAGLSRQEAYRVMEPIVTGTITNLFTLGTTSALTGPIARGDVETIKMHLLALKNHEPVKATYANLGLHTLHLAKEKNEATPQDLDSIERLLAN